MDFSEKPLTHTYHFKGKIMKARTDTALLPNGKECEREVCEHVGGVGVLPIDAEGNAILVRQFRYPFQKDTLEIPAGKLDQGPESHRACGERELREETGCTAGRLIYLGEMYPSPGFLTEVTYLYAALDLTNGESRPDEDEFVEVIRMPLRELEQKIADGEICDGKTIAAVCRARLRGLLNEFDTAASDEQA